MSVRVVRFTAEQRADLLRLGVSEHAFEMLETEALPIGRRLLERLAQLARLDRELGRAQATIRALFDAEPPRDSRRLVGLSQAANSVA